MKKINFLILIFLSTVIYSQIPFDQLASFETNPLDHVAGRCHKKLTLHGSGHHQIDISTFNDGIFILEISAGRSSEQKKLIINN